MEQIGFLANQMAGRTGQFLRGLNPAARAAAEERARQVGFLRLSPTVTQQWVDLIRQAHSLRGTADQIPTTSSGNAFLTGFAGGGGFNALGSLGSQFYGAGSQFWPTPGSQLPSGQDMPAGAITNPYTGQIQGGL